MAEIETGTPDYVAPEEQELVGPPEELAGKNEDGIDIDATITDAKEAAEKTVDDLVKDITGGTMSGLADVEKEFEDQKAKVQGLFDGLGDLTDSIGECSGLGEEFAEIAEKIDGLSDKFDALIDKFVDKITNVIGLPAVEVKFRAEYALLMAAMKKDFQAIGDVLGGLDMGFTDDLKDLAKLGIATYDFINKAEQMKKKYGNASSSIDEILDDPGAFLTNLGRDIETLCAAFPNYEKAKNGSVKLRMPPGALDFEISLREIISEGISPTLKKIEESLKEAAYSITLSHEDYEFTDERARIDYSHARI